MKTKSLLVVYVLSIAFLSGCGTSPERRLAEENQRIHTQRIKYEQQIGFCEKKGIYPKDPAFKACIDLAKAEQDVKAARAARCATNWFKVAAAFAKPQLGGFAASMGTVSEELERQRAIDGCD